jgi:hypothetical protein
MLAVAPAPQELVTTYLQLALCASELCAANKPTPNSAVVASFLSCEIFIKYFSYRYCCTRYCGSLKVGNSSKVMTRSWL